MDDLRSQQESGRTNEGAINTNAFYSSWSVPPETAPVSHIDRPTFVHRHITISSSSLKAPTGQVFDQALGSVFLISVCQSDSTCLMKSLRRVQE